MNDERNEYWRARDDIEAHGLARGGFGDPDGPMCLMGALNYARAGAFWESDAMPTIPLNTVLAKLIQNGWGTLDDELLASVLEEQYPGVTPSPGSLTVPWFNDFVIQTKDDAVLMLEKAAVRADEQADWGDAA